VKLSKTDGLLHIQRSSALEAAAAAQKMMGLGQAQNNGVIPFLHILKGTQIRQSALSAPGR
jgi:hypothetical protein